MEQQAVVVLLSRDDIATLVSESVAKGVEIGMKAAGITNADSEIRDVDGMAEFLQVSASQVKNMAGRGVIPSVRAGKRLLFLTRDVVLALKERKLKRLEV